MKKYFILPAAFTAALMLASCTSKEKKLFQQIQQMPTQELIAQYQQEFADGEFADSIKTKYAPIAAKIAEAVSSNDFRQMFVLADEVQLDSVKRWANTQAEKLLADSIQKNGTSEMCAIYIERFPNSPNKASFEMLQKDLKVKEEKEAAEKATAQKQINELLAKLAKATREHQSEEREIQYEIREYGVPGTIHNSIQRADYSEAEVAHQLLKNQVSKMTEAQLQQYNQFMNYWRNLGMKN